MKLGCLLLLVVLGLGGGAVAAVAFGAAPSCTSEPGVARQLDTVGATLAQAGQITVDDAEATTLARAYVGNAVQDGRVCFTPGVAHFSGKLPLGGVTPSFYATLGVDLSGKTPVATDVDVHLGSLPELPVISDFARQTVATLINQSLAQVALPQSYAVDFVDGEVTVREL